MAQADGVGIEYRDAPPNVTGTQIPSHSQTPATASNKGTQAPGNSTNSNDSDNESTESNSGGGGGTGANGGGGQGNSGSGQGNPASGPDASNLSNAQSLGNSTAGSESGGSSPLVPILIAIAVVMAVAIAAFVIRQRRQRRGPDAHVSPEAS
jgi:cobalamin biosynthesis Mg chelatase CobN